ncbi:MAG: hypothetical protein ACKESB_00330 [Candidatus Hodgkinia cicadicola]
MLSTSLIAVYGVAKGRGKSGWVFFKTRPCVLLLSKCWIEVLCHSCFLTRCAVVS